MRKVAYWVCFTLVAMPFTFGLLVWLLHSFGIALPFLAVPPGLFVTLYALGSPVPLSLAHFVPSLLTAALRYFMLFLLLRRLWLVIGKGERVPGSFRGFQLVLGYVGAGSFALALIFSVPGLLLRAGSDVPADLLLLPATSCVPWAILLTEGLSLRKAAAPHEA